MFSSKNLTVVEFDKDVELNLEKSRGSYLYDDLTNSSYLDFFQSFASNPLGYGHPVFTGRPYLEDLCKYGQIKISSGRVFLKYYSDFIEEFHEFANRDHFKRYFFIHGGALAVENALKVAFDYKRQRSKVPADDLKVMSFKKAFHGVSGYTMPLSDLPPSKVDGMPKFNWPKFESPHIDLDNPLAAAAAEDCTIAAMREYTATVGAQNIAAVIIEPIQCSGGDNQFRPEFFRALRQFCDEVDALLIFDEIQTGFGVTGTLWHYEQIGVTPDLLVFGKKAQVCGFAAGERCAENGAMHEPYRLSVTWDGHIVDVVRSRHLIKFLKGSDFLRDATSRGQQIVDGLQHFKEIQHVRNAGLLVAFDLPTQAARDEFYRQAANQKLLVNVASQRTIRLRPPLTVSCVEIEDFLNKTKALLA